MMMRFSGMYLWCTSPCTCGAPGHVPVVHVPMYLRYSQPTTERPTTSTYIKNLRSEIKKLLRNFSNYVLNRAKSGREEQKQQPNRA